MQTKVFLFKNRVICSILFLVIVFASTNVSAVSFKGWFRGSSGYDKAIQSAMNGDKPLIVYFNTDWCGWCNKMNKTYLSSKKVKKFLTGISKVEINPDNGKDEKSLEKKYGVDGYPSFYVSIPSFGIKAERVHPFKNKGDLTTDEFIAAIKGTLAQQFSDKGHASYKIQKYDEARKYLDMAIEYNPGKAYFYYLKGHIDYQTGYTTKNNLLLKEAEKN